MGWLFFSLHKEQTTVLPLLAEKHMPVYAIFMLYKRKQQNRWVYLSIKTQCKSCIFVFIYLGIRELISFKSADQEEAGKWILSPLAGGTGSREQRPEEVRRAGQRWLRRCSWSCSKCSASPWAKCTETSPSICIYENI